MGMEKCRDGARRWGETMAEVRETRGAGYFETSGLTEEVQMTEQGQTRGFWG